MFREECPTREPGSWYCDHTAESTLTVHGGITFSEFCHESEEGPGYGICHHPLDGRPEKVWWLGFDCAHCMDMSPYDAAVAAGRWRPGSPIPSNERDSIQRMAELQTNLNQGAYYRDVAYVMAQCSILAAQLKAVSA
jgi:hypothetical protein